MVGTSMWRQGEGRMYGIWNNQRVDQEGNKIWNVERKEEPEAEVVVRLQLWTGFSRELF